MEKNFFKKAGLGLSAAMMAGILAVLNFFSYNLFHRFDLTETNDYSISKISRKAAEGLDDIVNIRVYFSENLPSQYINLRQEVSDILDEYASFSQGKVRVEFKDPKDDKELEKELYLAGIPQLQFNVMEKDKYEVVNGYLGMIVYYGDKKESIPVIENTENLEYQVTLAIKKVTGKAGGVIGMLTSHGSLDLSKDISIAAKKLDELYDIEKVDLQEVSEIPQSIDTLVIPGPKEKFAIAEQKKIDSYLMSGGSILVLWDGVGIDQGLQHVPNETGLDGLFLKYGLKLNRDLVLDLSSGMASFSQGFFTYSVNYPFWPKIIRSGFDQDNAAVAKLESLVLPWASSVEVIGDKAGNKISYLAKTSDNSWNQSDNFDLNPQTAKASKNASKSFALAIADFGRFQSAFDNRPTEAGKIIAVGDSDFMTDNFLRNTPDNLIFFLNIIDSLSLDEDLINIRSKGIFERPLRDVDEGARAAIRYGNVFGMTVIVVVAGLARYFLRQRRDIIDKS